MNDFEERLQALEAAVFCGCECHDPQGKGYQLCKHCADILKPKHIVNQPIGSTHSDEPIKLGKKWKH